MNPQNFTIKSQEALGKAQQIAFDSKHAHMDTIHLLRAILDIDQDVTPFLLNKLNVKLDSVNDGVNQLLQKQPIVSSETIKIPLSWQWPQLCLKQIVF